MFFYSASQHPLFITPDFTSHVFYYDTDSLITYYYTIRNLLLLIDYSLLRIFDDNMLKSWPFVNVLFKHHIKLNLNILP